MWWKLAQRDPNQADKSEGYVIENFDCLRSGFWGHMEDAPMPISTCLF